MDKSRVSTVVGLGFCVAFQLVGGTGALAEEKKPTTKVVTTSSGKGFVSCIRHVSPSDEVAEDKVAGDVHVVEDRACPKKNYYFVTQEITHTLDLSSFCAELDKKGEAFQDRPIYFVLHDSDAKEKPQLRYMKAKLLRLPRTQDLVLVGSEVITKDEIKTNSVLETSNKALSRSARMSMLNLINSKVEDQLDEVPHRELLAEMGESEQDEIFRDSGGREIERTERDRRVSQKAKVQARATAKKLTRHDYRDEHWKQVQASCSPFLSAGACKGLSKKGYPCRKAWWSQFAGVSTD